MLSLALCLSACGGETVPDGGQPCQDDFECGVGEYCKNGICSPMGGDSDPRPCSLDTECEQDEICEGGICVPGERTDGGPDGADLADGGDGQNGDSTGDNAQQAPDLLLTGDVITHQDAQGTTYEINFGNVTLGVPVSRSLTIRNAGTADLLINVVTLNNDPQSEFSIQPEVPPVLTITPGEEHTLTIDYEAADGMTDRATARIFSNDPDEGQVEVQLISEFKGEVAIAVDPVSLDFGDVALATPSMLPVTIANQGTGNAVLRLDAVEPEAALAAAFSIRLLASDGTSELTAPTFINRGDFVTAEVTFSAQTRNAYDGDLLITSSDQAASPATVRLRGRAGVPSIEVEPASIDFGEVPTDQWAQDATVTIRNAGAGDLRVSDVSLTPAGDLQLAGVPGLPLLIAPAGQASFQVRYFPSGVGPDSALLSIAHDDPDQSGIQIAVGGSGIQGNARPTARIKADGVETDAILVQRGARVNLDGTASTDSDGTISAYQWQILQQPFPDNCANPESSLSNPAAPMPFLIVQRGGIYNLSLRVQDDAGAWSLDDNLSIQAQSKPVAEIRVGGNNTGFIETDMGQTLQFNGGFSTDCDGSVSAYQWTWVSYPVGRGTAPTISGGPQVASVLFDFPGDYRIGLVVVDNDQPANSSDQAIFDIRVRGPKAFRIRADWYNRGNNDQRVDVDLHLLKPGALSNWSPDACCPKEGGGGEDCDPNPNWGVLGIPNYQTDGFEDDGGTPGAPGDEINFSNPGMGNYTIKVQFRCHSSTTFPSYICCDEFFPCPFTISCTAEGCNRMAEGVVTVYITDYFNQETQLVQRPFSIDNEQAMSFDTIGVLSWPDGNFQ
jgi:hypothetical protein